MVISVICKKISTPTPKKKNLLKRLEWSMFNAAHGESWNNGGFSENQHPGRHFLAT